MLVTGGSTNVTTYFVLRLAADGSAATGLTITDIDLQYTRSGATPSAKVDATALGSTGAAHSDNKAIEIDATDQPGLYRVDWPDAAFAAGVREVILSVKCATAFTEHMRVEIDIAVGSLTGHTVQTGDTYALANGATGFAAIDTVVDAILVDTGTTLQAEVDAIQAAVITNAAGADIAADIIAVKAETASIVADTNELQTDDIPGSLATISGKVDTVDTVADAIKAKTDNLTFTSGTDLDANIQKVNDTLVSGTGTSGDEWGPA